MSAAYSGLTVKQRVKARSMIGQACDLMLAHKSEVHYTQDWTARWEGIRGKLRAWRGQYPHHSDCSSSATWILWQAYHHFGLGDKVNGTKWGSGYTGTLAQHGKTVRWRAKVGDLVLYGNGWPYEHVAVVRKGGLLRRAKVWSHGSEPGPYLLGIDYRPDRKLVKRFI